jgi:hypothetical protein
LEKLNERLIMPENSVWTFMASPIVIGESKSNSYGKMFDYDFDTYAFLTFGNEFKDWRLQPIHTDPKKLIKNK